MNIRTHDLWAPISECLRQPLLTIFWTFNSENSPAANIYVLRDFISVYFT